MRYRLLCLAVLLAAPLSAAGQARSLVGNGGFERDGGWSISRGSLPDGGRPGRCLRFENGGAASQDVLVAGRELTLTAAVDLRVDGVTPAAGRRGYAYAAVYQTDERGKLVTFRDFAQLTGTHGWQRLSYTFAVDPRADFVSLRCGLFQATGTAWFDNWTLVQGKQARRLDEVAEPRRRSGRPGGVAAILHEPGMPIRGAASSPQTIAAILEDAGFATRLLSADELADPTVLSPSAIDLVVLPTGQSFPAKARLAFVHFLRGGGDFIAMGGYAFHHLLRKADGRWQSEAEIVEARLERARSRERSLLPNGGFETRRDVPLRGMALDGHWRRNADACTIVAETPREGRSCAKVAANGTQFWLDLPAKAKSVYEVTGWVRTRAVEGRGMAFMALYQYDAKGTLVEYRDFAQVRGTTAWSRYRHTFSPGPSVARIHIKCGLYLAGGTAWFDDIRLGNVTGVELRPMNTATGRPRDGLEVSPAQIGVFDPSFPLTRASVLRTARGQHVVREPIELRRELEGWAASGVVGRDNARWLPLLQTQDRYGRPRGAAGALLLHYNGFYAGSAWACFGVENADLFASPTGPTARALQQVARFLRTKTFLHNLTTTLRLYREGEAPEATVVVDNRGGQPQRVHVRFALTEAETSRLVAGGTRELVVAADSRQPVEATFRRFPGEADLYRVAATLSIDGGPVDEMTAGFVVERPRAMQAGSELRFAGNYLTLAGRPLFLFGSDTYSYTYHSAHESPITWRSDHLAARDMGLNLYENLQYNRAGHKLADADWQAFRAMALLTQKANLVFMPGMLIGHNVAIGDAALAEQAAHCAAYATHLADTPALLYYINGDYRLDPRRHPDDVQTLWNRWLAERYGTTAKLRAAWGTDAVKGKLGALPFPPPNSHRWDDVAAIDRLRFLTWLTTRWNQAHVAAVRRHDTRHPITSEYYSSPFGGMDLRLSIDGQDLSNIGYFDRPVDDIDKLPLKLRWNDLRARGKGLSLGEYGVKTHPAWSVENGAVGYHIVRTEEQQAQLFLAVAHYALGMGACKIQNWCLRDAQARVFPWGIFYPNQLIPKPVAYVHRNQSIVWRHFAPRYVAPPLAVCIPNSLRLGNRPELGTSVAYRTFADLLALHHDFSVVDDHHLGRIPAATRVMIYPSPLALGDEAFAELLAWVKGGGTLLVTGDLSFDADRRRTRTERLEKLAGVGFVAEHYPAIARNTGKDRRASFSLPGLGPHAVRPCIRVKPVGAEVLGTTADGEPVLVRHQVGRGTVTLLTDPVELAADDEAQAFRRRLYAAFLRAAKVEPLPVEPDAPWLHVLAQPTAHGSVHVVFNTKLEEGTEVVRVPTAAGQVALTTRNRWPALAAATSDGKLVAVNAYGSAKVGGERLLDGTGLKALLSLDGADLRRSQAVLVAPFEPGTLVLPPRRGLVAHVGEFRGGRWTTLERVEPKVARGKLRLDIDADRATCLILLCAPDTERRWAAHLTKALRHPEQLAGY